GGLKAKCTVSVEIPATSLKISKTSLTLYAGKTYTLTSSISPSNTTNKTIKWTSSNEKVAVVSSAGKITAVGGGKATITAKTSNGLTCTCTVTVLKSVSSVSLNKTAVSVYTGSSVKLSASVLPSDASNKKVTWSSSNKNIASVDESGNVKAVKAGTAVITVTTVDGGFKDTCKVTVLQHVTSISLNKTSLVVPRGTETKLVATVLPSDASDKTVKWTSSDPKVVTVSVSGEIVAKAVGAATVTAVTADGAKKASCVINVYESVTGVALDIKEKILYIGESVTVNAVVSPSDASNKGVSFVSSDASVANVGSNGKITALKVGTATITVKTADGGFTDTCKITVRAHVSSVKLSDSKIMLSHGKTQKLTCSVLPSDAYDKSVQWETSDADIVSVSASGEITAKAVGEATITVVTTDEAKKASCTVTVYESVTGVSLDVKEKILYIGESVTVNASVLPADATNKSVSFISSDSTVAKAEANGVVTALKVGTATITVKTADGGFTDTCKITVRAYVSAISLSENTINLKRGETHQLTVLVTPENSYDKSMIWESEDPTVASVENGMVTAVGRGETVITVESVDGGFTASCKVVVTQPVTGISLSSTELSVYTGQSVSLEAVVSPENASDKRVTFQSSDESVAQVDEKGSIKGISGGTALISAETADGHYLAVCHVTVNVTAEKIELNASELSLARGEKATVIPTVLPADTFNKNVTWTSENEDIAEVDENGVITAVKAGKTTIVCKAVIGDAESEVEVEVYEPVSAIEVRGDSTQLWVGQTMTLQAQVSPEDATNKTVIWESEDEQIATVENGVVTAGKAGTVNIIAYSFDKKVSGRFTLTVNQQVTEILLDTESVTLNENGEITLTASVLPDNALNKAIVWSSTDDKVATVDETGKVTAVAKGECQITVSSADGFTVAQCAVQVIRPVTSVNISNKQLSLEKGDTFELTASAYPADASDTSITWISSAPEICQVSDNGTITAKKGGQAVITAQSSNRDVCAQCAVTVEVTSTDIQLDIAQIELWENESVTVSCLFTPQDVTDTSVKWTSSNSDIATVENGRITAKSVGTAVITATANDSGKSTSCTVKVSRKTQSVVIEQTEITLENGESFTLSAKVLPEDATYKTLSWTTSDKDVAVVDESGTVTAKGAGTAAIVATTDEGGNKAVCNVTVTQKPKSITLSEQNVTLTEGGTATLTASFLPLSTTEKELIWETSDERIACVKDGVITAVSLGKATITARSAKDESVFARCEINVLRAAGSVALNKNEITLSIGQEEKLTAVVGPEGASNQAVTWTTSDRSVAEVDENGLVKAVGEGTALITVTTEDGGFVAVCFVMVQKADE
ncbi:MAG: Ig domain-containing protein, partial [Acutalibacteraceae bacterium]